MAEFDIVIYNVNFILLYSVLSVIYMAKTGRRMIVSIRRDDIKTPGNFFNYLAIGVIQSLVIGAAENWLLERGFSLYELSTTFIMCLALLFFIVIGQESGRIPK